MKTKLQTTTRTPQSLMMRLRLRLYPHRRYLKWLRRVARWQMQIPVNEFAQWRFCRWVSLLTTDPDERVMWRMPETSLVLALNLSETIPMHLYYRNAFQPEIVKWVHASLDTDALFVDAGANIGIMSLIAADVYRARIGDSSKPTIYAFEPNPGIFAELAENIRCNHLETFICAQPEALAEKNAAVPFHLSSQDNGTSSSLAAHDTADANPDNTIQVQAIALTDFIRCTAENRRVGLLKMDIEGAELLALRGAQEILLRDHPTIIMEIHPTRMRAFGYTLDDTRAFLSAFGYDIHRILPDGTLTTFSGDEWSAHNAYGDVICIPHPRTTD